MSRPVELPIGSLPARCFVRALDARGIDCTEALRAAGITREQLEEPRHELPAGACIALAEALCALDLSEDLGVLAGTRVTIADLDLAGLYLRSTATLRDAASFHRTHGPLLERLPFTTHFTSDAGFVISFAPRASGKIRARLDDCMLASSLTVMRAVLGPLEAVQVRLRHAAPADTTTHTRVFGPRVRFGCDVDMLILPHDVWRRTLPHRDDAVRAVLEPHLARRIEEVQAARADLPSRVLAAMREDLHAAISAQALARRLRISPRSLRRALQAHGTSYSVLLSQVRCELARAYVLESPQRSGPELAALLGYADPHTFYRAFKRWTGTSLRTFRGRNTSRPPPRAT